MDKETNGYNPRCVYFNLFYFACKFKSEINVTEKEEEVKIRNVEHAWQLKIENLTLWYFLQRVGSEFKERIKKRIARSIFNE